MRSLAALIALGTLAQDAPVDEPTPKVLMVFVDGFLPDAIALARTPNLDRLIRRGAWSLEARAESTTISGSGWSTFLNGVHWDKHGVPDNAFEAPRYGRYPHVIQRLKEARPEARAASANCWRPIEDGLVAPSGADRVIYHEYYDYDDDYFDDESCDAKSVADLAEHLRDADPDLAVIMFGELDGVGHLEGNAHYYAEDPLYRRMLTQVDEGIGFLLDAIRARPTHGDEDWLILVSSDHGGSQGLGHGRNLPSHRKVPLVVSGPRVARGEIWPPPQPCDLATTALHHLGVALRPEWELDGVVLGREKTAPPKPALGANLIFHGDAELERGFAHYSGAPDASVAGWDDPSWMTVLTYGAGEGFPGPGDALPEGCGASFFAGGGTAEPTWMEQEIDLRPLAAELSGGVEYELSGWLGGFADQADACRLTARFLDAGGEELAHAELAPVTAEDRDGATGFVHRSATGTVPRGVRSVLVRLEANPAVGMNDGYADGLRLVLR
ncbi:MAG: alkaline phosphatase family protein [Planctomycetota bacterium]